MSVKRFRPICQFLEDGTPVAVLAEFHEGYVSGDDYDALRAERDEAVALLLEAGEQIGQQDPFIDYDVLNRIDAFLAKLEAKP